MAKQNRAKPLSIEAVNDALKAPEAKASSLKTAVASNDGNGHVLLAIPSVQLNDEDVVVSTTKTGKRNFKLRNSLQAFDGPLFADVEHGGKWYSVKLAIPRQTIDMRLVVRAVVENPNRGKAKTAGA